MEPEHGHANMSKAKYLYHYALEPLPSVEDGKTPRRVKSPEGVPPYLASLYDVPLLSREQEAHLFRKMNYHG